MSSLIDALTETPPLAFAIPLGLLAGLATRGGVRRCMQDLDLPPGRWPAWFGLAGWLLGTLFVLAALGARMQSTPEVIPVEGFRQARVVYHLSLIVLLLLVASTDLRSYYILDWCCLAGIGIALIGAVVSGDFQLAHLWVDWNAEVPQLRGPHIPDWIGRHPYLHGLAWSIAGLLCGAAATWLIRAVSSRLLGMEALGAGDILLMAMVGAYLGWQATLVVLLLAPVLALGIGAVIRLRGNQAALPYGPFLALAALLTLFFWRDIWMAEFALSLHLRDRESVFAVRRFMGDPIALILVAGLSSALLLLMLGLLRIYKTLPVGSRHGGGRGEGLGTAPVNPSLKPSDSASALTPRPDEVKVSFRDKT